jgi:hypothetical protein
MVAALGRTPPDRTEVLAALAAVPQLRRDLDGIEGALVDAARECGAGWPEIAAALGLRSRQAAEQRRLRLAGAAPGRDPGEARARRLRQRSVDISTGEEIVALRAAVRELANAVDRGTDWDRHGRVDLVRRTLLAAVDAEPGALVDLARLAVADLATDDLAELPGGAAIAQRLERVRELIDGGH